MSLLLSLIARVCTDYRRIVEAMAPEDGMFPSPESIEKQGDFEV